MNPAADRPTPHAEDPIAAEARRLESTRRVDEAERAAAALRRRAEAAEVRVSEARERVTQERASREEALAELTGLLDAERRRGTELSESLQDELAELKARLSEAESSLAEREEDVRAAFRETTERVEAATRAAREQAESGKAAVEEIQHRLAGELQRREQLLLLPLSDATAKLQADLVVLQHRIAGGQEELQAARLARRTAEAILDTERSAFARERSDLESRVQRAVAAAEATMAGERAARQRERGEIAGSLSSLRTDIESTIGALHEKLEAEVPRTHALTGALEQRNETLVAEATVARYAEDVPLEDTVDPASASAPDAAGDPAHRPTEGRETSATDEPVTAAPDPFDLPRGPAPRPLGPTSRRLSDILPGPAPAEPRRPSVPAIPAAAHVEAEEAGIDEISRRFDRIRAQLAERGIRSARVSGERRPGGPR